MCTFRRLTTIINPFLPLIKNCYLKNIWNLNYKQHNWKYYHRSQKDNASREKGKMLGCYKYIILHQNHSQLSRSSKVKLSMENTSFYVTRLFSKFIFIFTKAYYQGKTRVFLYAIFVVVMSYVSENFLFKALWFENLTGLSRR